MAIEITPRVKIKLPGWTIITGLVLLILLIGLIAVYIYFEFSLRKMSQGLQEKDIAVAPLEKVIAEKEAELEPIDQKINDFNKLLVQHKKTIDIFLFLESICLPSVWFSEFSFSSNTREVTLFGQTDNFATLEQQIDILKQEPVLRASKITEVSVGEEGNINFTFSLLFK